MIYAVELIKGIFIALGIIIGFMILAAKFISYMKKVDSYVPGDLVKPFEEYKVWAQENEHFEIMLQLEKIILALKGGKLPPEIKDYVIKSETCIIIADEEGNSTLRFVKKYKVEGIFS